MNLGNETVRIDSHIGHHLEGIGHMSDERMKEMQMRQKIIEQHKGHDTMHIEMLFIFLVILFIAQIILFEWKRRHYKSYQMVTLIGLWIIPFVMSVKHGYWRFIVIWLSFSFITAFIVRKAIEKPISGTTPRLVYKWFYLIYKTSYVLGIIGYTIMMLTIFGINAIFNTKSNVWMDTAMIILFYGLYYGVMGQDVSELCTDKMASHIGYYTSQGMPTRFLERDVCAVCGNKFFVSTDEPGVLESTYQLSCKHVFHEFCIRGWCIVGKKQICPYCKEKVDLKMMFPNPWEKPHVLYGQLLDWIRWLLAWQPIVLLVFRAINYLLGLE